LRSSSATPVSLSAGTGGGAATSIPLGSCASLGTASLTLRHGSRLRERLVREHWQEHESSGNDHD